MIFSQLNAHCQCGLLNYADFPCWRINRQPLANRLIGYASDIRFRFVFNKFVIHNPVVLQVLQNELQMNDLWKSG